MLELRDRVKRVARTDETVLIQGERGTGKELVAHTLHREGRRRGGNLIIVDCAALTETVFESDLFGHERGSFTGAHKQKIGLVEDARGGTLFLDEISHLTPKLQGKLLRFLQTRTIRRVGGLNSLEIDARIVAATNRDLGEMVQRGEFLPDLLDRLNVLRIDTPPLREHREDIPELIAHYARSQGMDGQFREIPQEAIDLLQAHAWPGNVRELFNVLSRAALLAEGRTPGVEDFRAAIE
jgi:DNA-binding NtrC family response regulator